MRAGFPSIETLFTVLRFVPEIVELTPPWVVPELGETVEIVGDGQFAKLVTIVGDPGSNSPLIKAVLPGFTRQLNVWLKNAPLVLVSTAVSVLGNEIHFSTFDPASAAKAILWSDVTPSGITIEVRFGITLNVLFAIILILVGEENVTSVMFER